MRSQNLESHFEIYLLTSEISSFKNFMTNQNSTRRNACLDNYWHPLGI